MAPEIALFFLLPLTVFVLGAFTGSFLNILIDRIPRRLEGQPSGIRKAKRGFCPNCGRKIPAHLRIPIVSWLVLKGRCKFCKSKIGSRNFAVESITAMIFFVIWALFFPTLGVLGAIAIPIFSNMNDDEDNDKNTEKVTNKTDKL